MLPAFTHADDAATAFKSKVMPVLSAHCTKCHGEEKQKGKVNLSGVRTLEQFSADSKLWFRVLEQIESGTMPPNGEKPLAPADKKVLASWANGELTDWLTSVEQKEGRSKFRRFNRNEYANTIHDLFGFRPAVVRNLLMRLYNMLYGGPGRIRTGVLNTSSLKGLQLSFYLIYSCIIKNHSYTILRLSN